MLSPPEARAKEVQGDLLVVACHASRDGTAELIDREISGPHDLVRKDHLRNAAALRAGASDSDTQSRPQREIDRTSLFYLESTQLSLQGLGCLWLSPKARDQRAFRALVRAQQQRLVVA